MRHPHAVDAPPRVAPPASCRALYISRLRRETHRALTEAPESELGARAPFARPSAVDLVVRACLSAIRALESAASRAASEGRETVAAGSAPPEDEDADALVAGLNFFRLVLGRAGRLRADSARDVAVVRSRRAMIGTRVASPATAWARSTLARLDGGEGASSAEKRMAAEDTDDAAASRAWRARMGAEHVLEAARFVSELCDETRRDDNVDVDVHAVSSE